MPFQIKDFQSIVASEINHARSVTEKVTDFLPGSVVRTILEAPAVEIEELYLQMFLGLRDAIPVATFRSFGFDKLAAAKANGFASVSSPSPLVASITIPIGTVFTALDGRLYYSTAAVTWLAGSSLVRIPIRHADAGLIGNISQGQITSSAFFDSTYTVSNSAISNGRDVESNSEREARFAAFIKSLSRGTVVACLYAAGMSVVLDEDGNIEEYVTKTGYVEIPGRMTIYVYSSLGTPSAALLANGQLRIDGSRDDIAGTITPGYRAAGVRVEVLAMQEREIDLSIEVEMLPGYTLTSAVQQFMSDVFNAAIRAVRPETTLYLGTLIELMLAAPGVRKIVPLSDENIPCAASESLTPGTLAISPL